MNAIRRKALLSFLGMSAVAATAKVAVPTRKLADTWLTELPTMFPARFGNWQVDESQPIVLPAPDIQAKLDELYNQVLARTYLNMEIGQRVMLSVAYGGDQSDSTNAHLPEVCYPAQGFQVVRIQREVIQLEGRELPVKRMVSRLGSRTEPVTYWLTIGEAVSATVMERKLLQMRYGLRGLIPDGMLVRVSTIDRDVAQSFRVQDSFLAAMAHAVPREHVNRVLGQLAGAAA